MTPKPFNEEGQETDLFGRVELHQIGLVPLARHVPGFYDQFIDIPGEYWAVTEEHHVEVSCPCGETPAVELNGLKTCECERVYMYTGKSVRAANRPDQYPVPTA